ALLGRLQHRVDRPAAIGDGAQRRLGGNVVVPHIVMRGLERPGDAAIRHMQRDDGVGVFARAGTKPAEEIRAGAGHRQDDEAACLVDAHRRPHIGRPAAEGRLLVAASKACTVPRNSSTFWLSSIEEPTITRPCVTTGAEVVWMRPKRSVFPSRTAPGGITTVPFAPKPAQGLPLAASSAMSRRSAVLR